MNAFHTRAMLTTMRQTFDIHGHTQLMLRQAPAVYEQLWHVTWHCEHLLFGLAHLCTIWHYVHLHNAFVS